MDYRTLGRTGMRVSTLCLGTMMFGAWGKTDPDDCARMLDRALDAGVNFIDTADVYAFGESEEILGAALGGRRDAVVLATKVNNAMGADPNERGNSRRWITRALEDSLRRLRTDWVDLYQIHRFDPSCDIDETLGVLSDLMQAGKVRAIGTSTFPVERLVEAQWVSEARHRERFSAEQPPYSIFTRAVETAVLPTCLRYGIGTLVYSPLNGGWLTGKYRRGVPAPAGSRALRRESDHFDFGGPVHDRKIDLVEELLLLAAEIHVPLCQLALAFVLRHPAVTSAIVGPRTLDQLDEQLPAAGVVLDDAVLDRIDALVRPGENLNPRDAGWDPPELEAAARRRPR